MIMKEFTSKNLDGRKVLVNLDNITTVNPYTNEEGVTTTTITFVDGTYTEVIESYEDVKMQLTEHNK